jgi:hypothetical protein
MSDITLISADRATHLKIVGVAVIASVIVGLVGFNARGMQATSSSRLEPAPAPTAVGGGVAQSSRSFLPNSTRGSSRTNNQTSGGSNVQFQPG